MKQEEEIKKLKEVINKMYWITVNLTDSWASKKIGYDNHKCNGQDGSEIGFTKKTFEDAIQKIIELKESVS